MRATLRLGNDEIAAEQLDRITGAEDPDLDQTVVRRPRPLPGPDRILHDVKAYGAPPGASTPRLRYTRFSTALWCTSTAAGMATDDHRVIRRGAARDPQLTIANVRSTLPATPMRQGRYSPQVENGFS